MLPGAQRTLTLLFLILLGFCLKSIGFLGKEERQVIAKLYTYITFPGVIVSSFRPFTREMGMLWMVPLGLAIDCVMMLLAVGACRRRSREDRAFAALNCSAFSIGAFTLPFLQGYLAPGQLIPVMLYDIGNGVFSFGGTAMAGRAILDWGKAGNGKAALKRLLRSVPVWTYLIMLLLGLLNTALPEPIYATAEFIGGANPVLTMLLVGCTLDFPKRSGQLAWVGKLLLVHYGTVLLLSGAVYLFLPAPQSVRSLVVVLLFSPLGLAGMVLTEQYGLDHNAAGILNSLTILIGIACISVLIPLLGVGS